VHFAPISGDDIERVLVKTLFSGTTPPDPSVFFHRDEPGDVRLGETVLRSPEEFSLADVVLLGCPQDEGVRRNNGRPGAAKAPDAIRHCLYRLISPPNVRLFDLGNTVLQSSLEETHRIHQQTIREILAGGKQVISLGGGNDISYPDCAALAETHPECLAFNIDAHLDVRENPVRNSGTPYRMLLEERLLNPGNFYELGYQPFSVAQTHLDYLASKGAHAMSLPELRRHGIHSAIGKQLQASDAEAIFWGIDMDSVCAADAPGVSAPNPTGLTFQELCAIAELAGSDPRSRIFEITEVNPDFDIDNRTARLAAVAIFHFLGSRP
jgi:formiminoglutamase